MNLHLIPQAYAQGYQPQKWQNSCVSKGVATVQGLECLIANILSVAITAIGLAGFVMILIGAFRYLVAGSNSQQAEKARNGLTFAVIGLVLGLSAFIILNLIAQFTGVRTILEFVIPSPSTSPG